MMRVISRPETPMKPLETPEVEMLSEPSDPHVRLRVRGEEAFVHYLADEGGGLAIVRSSELVNATARAAFLAWCAERWPSHVRLEVDFRLDTQNPDDDSYARANVQRMDNRASLISEISAAFAGVRLGGGIGLFEAQGLDDYALPDERRDLRERDEKDDWTVLSAEELNSANSSLSFFDAEGMRFHLPAYLIADLRGDYRHDVVFTLCQAAVRAERFSLLTGAQRVAVRRYLEFVAKESDHDFDRLDIEQCLAGYWST
ncbi:MAG: hypothetical protein NVSMB1_22880 [Polyangiales bacterium]